MQGLPRFLYFTVTKDDEYRNSREYSKYASEESLQENPKKCVYIKRVIENIECLVRYDSKYCGRNKAVRKCAHKRSKRWVKIVHENKPQCDSV
jgi:hypothetical protein